MNICFVINSLGAGGAQRVVSVLSHKLSEKHNVTVILTDNKDCVYHLPQSVKSVFLKDYSKGKTINLNQKLKTVYFKIKRKFNKNLTPFGYYIEQSLWLQRYFEENPQDVIFGFMVYASIMLSLIKTKAKIIMAERVYPSLPICEQDPVEIRNKFYKKGDKIVFQTEEIRDMFAPDIREKGVVIPNPIKENLPLYEGGDREKIIVNYGSLSKDHKNIPLLFKAFDIVAETHPDHILKIYGYGELNQKAKETLDNLKNKDKVFLLPFESDIHDKIKKYGMFVMTSDYEGMPNSLIEAMGIGLPVISTDCKGGGAKALIKNHINGIITPPNNSEAVADAIKFYIDNPKKAEEYAKEALKIRDDLSVDKISEKWMNLI